MAAVAVAGIWLLAYGKFHDAYQQHQKKLAAGHTLQKVDHDDWSDGTDIVLTYSNGSTIRIKDEGVIPRWAVIRK